MQRSRRQGLGVWLLLYQIFGVVGINNIPPATLAITALQVLIFLRVLPLPWFSASDVCISVDTIWHQKHFIRLFYGAIEHGSDMHLYYNMISFIWKGISLERRFGSARFAYLIAVFTALCSVTLVGLCKVAGEYFDRYYYHQCAVGFSGVLFALKVLTSHYWPYGSSQIMGIQLGIPIRYLVWVELLLIQVLVPNASLIGHLAGILVGLAYIHTPVGFAIDTSWKIVESVLFMSPVPGNRFRSTNTSGRNNANRNYSPDGMTEEEQFEFARQESLRSHYNQNSQYAHGFSQQRPSSSWERGPYSSDPPASAPYPERNDFPGQSYRSAPYPETDYVRPTIPTGRLYPDLDELRNNRSKRFS